MYTIIGSPDIVDDSTRDVIYERCGKSCAAPRTALCEDCSTPYIEAWVDPKNGDLYFVGAVHDDTCPSQDAIDNRVRDCGHDDVIREYASA